MTDPTRDGSEGVEPPLTVRAEHSHPTGEHAPLLGLPGPSDTADNGTLADSSTFAEGASAASSPADLTSGSDESLRTHVEADSGPGVGTTRGQTSSTSAPRVVVAPTIRGYEIEGELGRGGMGVVYKARQILLNRTCALKMILAGEHAGAEASVRFLTEAEAAARLKHPNIVQVFHFDEHDGCPYFEMEFVEGGSLAARLDGTPRAPREAVRLVETLTRAMAEAHRQGVVHRDLKPGNVLLTAEGTPKVADFGLAKMLDADSALTRTDSILGSPSYMAPEQAEGKTREIGPAADLYALGAILYELLVGRPPFRGATVLDTLQQVKTVEPVSPSRLVPGLPRDVETVVLKCLQKDPSKRYESATALAEDLRRCQSGEPIVARPVGSLERGWRWCRRNPIVAGLLASITLLLTAVAVGASTAYVRESLLRAQARADAESNRRLSYASDVQLAAQLWESDEGTADQVAALLAAQEPAPGQVDLREFAWRYQWTLLNRSAVALAGHDGAVPALAFTPEGRLTTVDSTGTLRVWDPARRAVVYSLGPIGPLHEVPAAEPSPDVYGAPEFPQRLRARDVTATALSHDGRRMAFATPDALRLTDADTGAVHRDWPRRGPTRLLAFCPDGRWLAALGHDRTVTMADTANGRETVLGTTTLGERNLGNETALVAAADGRTVWVANAPQIGAVMAVGGPTPRVWYAHRFTVRSIALSRDGRRLASGDFEGRVHLWDANAPTMSEADRAAAVDPLSRARWDATARGSTARDSSQAEWDAHASRVTALAFSPDGRTLASGGGDAAVAVWDVSTARRLRLLKGHLGVIQALAFSDDGATLASSDDRGTARLWDLAVPETSRRFMPSTLPVPAFHLAYSRDGRWLATTWGPVVSLWDARTQKLAHRLTGDSDAVYRVAFAPDGQTLATGGRDSLVKLWDVATGRLVRTLRGRPSDPLNYPHDAVGALTFSHDGTRLAAGFGRPGLLDPDYDQVVKVWDIASGRELRTLPGLKNTVPMLAFSPDGRTLVAACHDRTVRLWSTATWQELRTLRGPAPWQSVAFAPGGRTLAAGVETFGLIRLWDADDGRVIRDLQGHASGVSDLSFAPDGRTLASASWDRTVKLWDPATGRELRTLRGHDGWVMCVAFAPPDGRTLATGGYDDTVRLWQTASSDEVAAIQAEQRAEAAPSGAEATPPL